nr:hypothetical protein [Tanacetum cinerariifolium]
MGKTLSNFDIPSIMTDVRLYTFGCCKLRECSIVIQDEDILARHSLITDKEITYDTIMRHVDVDSPGVFLIDGPGGTGKTFLNKALLTTVRSRGLIALATVSSRAGANNMTRTSYYELFPDEEKVYNSFNEAEDNTHNFYPLAFLNSLNMSGLPEELLREPNDDERDSRSGIGKSIDSLSQRGTKNNDSARRDDDGHPDDSTSVKAGCDNLESAILDENDIESEGDDNFYQDFYEQFHSPVINPGSQSVNLRRSTRKTSMPAKLSDLSGLVEDVYMSLPGGYFDTTDNRPTATGKRLKMSAKVGKPAKEKQPAKSSKANGLTVLSEVALTEAEQIKLAIKRSLIQTHISHASGSGADGGTDDDDDQDYQDDDADQDDQNDDDDEQTDSDNDGDDFVHLKFSTHDEEDKDKESFDPIVQTPSQVENTNDSSSVSSRFVSDMLKPSPDTGIDSIFESTPQVDVLVMNNIKLPLLSAKTLPPSSIPIILHVQQTPVPSPVNVPSSSLQDLPNFGSLFRFDHRLKTLETNFSKFMQTNQFAKAISLIPGIVDKYIDHRMNEVVKVSVRLQSDRLQDEAQAENEDLFNKLDENIQKIIMEQIKVQVSKILPKIEKTVNEQLEADVLTPSSNSSKTSHTITADLSELKLKKILIDKMESNKCRDDKDKDKKPFAGSNWGAKRIREGKEPESTSALKEKTSKTSGKSTEGSKSHHKTTSESAPAEVPIHTTQDLEELAPQEFKTGATDDQPIKEASHYPHWESALDVYSKRRIIAVTELQIVEWHNYKHLDWITVRRDDDKLYKFKEGDFKTLCIQEIEDMLLLLYLPQTIWRRSNKNRAAAMIQAIDKQLKTRSIMRSLEKFVGGRLYEGDFWLLQRTI